VHPKFKLGQIGPTLGSALCGPLSWLSPRPQALHYIFLLHWNPLSISWIKYSKVFFSLAFEGTSPTLKMVMVAWTFSHLHAKSSAIQMKTPFMKTKLYFMLGIACSQGLPLIFSGLQHHWAATLKATTLKLVKTHPWEKVFPSYIKHSKRLGSVFGLMFYE